MDQPKSPNLLGAHTFNPGRPEHGPIHIEAAQSKQGAPVNMQTMDIGQSTFTDRTLYGWNAPLGLQYSYTGNLTGCYASTQFGYGADVSATISMAGNPFACTTTPSSKPQTQYGYSGGGFNFALPNPTMYGDRQQMTLVTFGTLTREQLAARKVTPKDLPQFNGDPEDFPLFISSYEQSTALCGFTNQDNLLRLQNALKGDARDKVRALLTLLGTVPFIIDSLRNRYGRPELIIDCQI